MISFEFDSGGPSRIEAWVPSVTNSNVSTIWQPDSESAGMEAHVDENKTERMMYLQNKAPKWDEAHGGHVLNFQVAHRIFITFQAVLYYLLCNQSGGLFSHVYSFVYIVFVD